MAVRLFAALIVGAAQIEACAFSSGSNALPLDEVHNRVSGQHPWSHLKDLIRGRISARGNAFHSMGMLQPALPTGGSKLLADELLDFAATQDQEMCYWSFQPLVPPKGKGHTLRHPFRHHYDIFHGQWDDDIEWELMLANIASARMKRIQNISNGTLVSSMCASGLEIALRRCNSGRAATDTWMDQCDPVIKNQKLQWAMAITIWKIGPEIKDWIRYWRSNHSFGHTPNIQWVYRGGTPSADPYVWNNGAPIPPPVEIDHEHVPHGPHDWAASRGQTWGAGDGAGLLAKVLPCSQVPTKFQYPDDQFYCDHVSPGAFHTTADEAYEFWKEIDSVWPPTKECADNVTLLNLFMGNLGLPAEFDSCTTATAFLHERFGNFNCDAIFPGRYQFRDLCCSECGASRIPDLPEVPPPTPAPIGDVYVCQVCQHKYDSAEDGDGLAFENLPDNWLCPVCGMPKATYKKQISERELLV